MNNDFEWGLCTYKRDGEKENVTYFYIKYGETKKEEFLFISDEVIRVKNTVIFDLTSKSGKQITIEKGTDEGVEFDQSVNYLYDYKIRVNLNSDETAKDVFVSYKHKDESDYTKEIINMDDYKENGKLQKELFANNFGQDVIDSGKTEIEIYSDVNGEIEEAVYELSSLQIMEGYGDNTFRPDETLTRAEASAIMVRLLNLDEDIQQGETIFSDVPESHWASGYVNKAVEEGIIAGYGDGTFRPDEHVTYHQMVKMLVCALGYEPVALSNGGWNGGGYLTVASKIGLTTGIPGTSGEVISRGKAAQLTERALDIELMDGGDGIFKVSEGKTIRSEYWGK